jgi:hypothetical protein
VGERSSPRTAQLSRSQLNTLRCPPTTQLDAGGGGLHDDVSLALRPCLRENSTTSQFESLMAEPMDW